MTVKQLESATQMGPSDPYKLDGAELSNVRIVGKLVEIQDEASTCKFLLFDGTGSIQLTKYTDQSAEWANQRSLWT